MRGRPAAARALRFLAAEGQRLHSKELVSLAQEGDSPGGLDKVKDLIRHMLAQKMTQQAESTDHHAFCGAEMGKSEKKVARLQQEAQKIQADLDEDSAKLAELKDNVADIHEELSSAHKGASEAMKLRSEEHQRFVDQKAQYEQDEEKLARAAAQMETTDEKAMEAAHEAAEKAVEKRVKAEQAEQRAAFEYEESTKKLEVMKASKTKLAEDHEHTMVRMQHDLVEKQTDLRSTQEELDAAKDYAEKLKAQCVVSPDSHKERKQRREDEIGSLKEAYTILNGEGIPVLG